MTTPRERRLLAALRFIASCPSIYSMRGPDFIAQQMETVATETVARETQRHELFTAMRGGKQ